MTRLFLGLPAPAKLNLFLHVVGRRGDGYHELQSAFVPIDLVDTLSFELLDEARIERRGDIDWPEDADLAVRAARLLQQFAGTTHGVAIDVTKRIPSGSGMGGGSSDAATTLLALNRLWGLNLARHELQRLGVGLGADVPFFLGPGPAFVEGIGERLTPLTLQPAWYAVVYPQVTVSTAKVFGQVELTQCTKATTISDFSAAATPLDDANCPAQKPPYGANDLEVIVRRQYPQVDAALRYLGNFGNARMTGSGSAVFARMPGEVQARGAVEQLPNGWQGFVTRSLVEHPLAAW